MQGRWRRRRLSRNEKAHDHRVRRPRWPVAMDVRSYALSRYDEDFKDRSDADDATEARVDAMARETLVPSTALERFLADGRPDDPARIRRFASELGRRARGGGWTSATRPSSRVRPAQPTQAAVQRGVVTACGAGAAGWRHRREGPRRLGPATRDAGVRASGGAAFRGRNAARMP